MRSFLTKKVIWLILAIFVVGGIVVISFLENNNSENKNWENKNNENSFLDSKIFEGMKKKFSIYPDCPANLEGILTAPLMDPKNISNLIPLGNINPPGHTSPVDHIYFGTQETEKIPLYAPANAWITEITEIAYKNELGEYVLPEYAIRYTVCDGLDLVFASHTELVPEIKAEIDRIGTSDCKGEISKIGHTSIERQCYYKVNIPVKSGDLTGWVQPYGDGRLPFEIWAFNYNKLSRDDIDWAYYDKDSMFPYPRAFCLFDLYMGDLKVQYYSKFGFFDQKSGNAFKPRTIEPICGQVNQDITGTIQGMWYGENNPDDKDIEAKGKGLAFIHNNIDPLVAEISIGGNFMDVAVISFDPKHTGSIDREFSEVKADGKIYCYNEQVFNKQAVGGKVLVQLIGDRELKVEYQNGGCIGNEVFKTSYNYYR